MTLFIRLTDVPPELKGHVLSESIRTLDERVYDRPIKSFLNSPNSGFSYWLSDAALAFFIQNPAFESDDRTTKCGLGTLDDFRFLRLSWEVAPVAAWVPFNKGGSFSPWFSDIYMRVNWRDSGKELKAFVSSKVGSESRKVQAQSYYFREGLTFPRRPAKTGWFSIVPRGTIFSDNGPMVFVANEELYLWMGFLSAALPHYLMQSVMNRGQEGSGASLTYEVGIVARVPVPLVPLPERLGILARLAYSLARILSQSRETSIAFQGPEILLGAHHSSSNEVRRRLGAIQAEIDEIVFQLYGIDSHDRTEVLRWIVRDDREPTDDSDHEEADDFQITESDEALVGELHSWAIGVVFGRFDLQCESAVPDGAREADPFEPMPTKSPAMLLDGAEPFHRHDGVLVDDTGHRHDLAHLVEEMLLRVKGSIPEDVRRWLRRDFFVAHLKRYSRSRRRAPIYWPLATASGSYTLWLYYPSLSSQTLYTAINDFLDGPSGKLTQVAGDVAALRNKGPARTRDEEKRFENLEGLELELIELRDQLLKIAPTYQPHHDDGVQITAAPLWPLFRHKPWQKILKETWAKLEKGDYDWAHLALNYWPDRVREKCKADKSLAIAHGLEHLYIEPPPKAAAKRGRKAKAA